MKYSTYYHVFPDTFHVISRKIDFLWDSVELLSSFYGFASFLSSSLFCPPLKSLYYSLSLSPWLLLYHCVAVLSLSYFYLFIDLFLSPCCSLHHFLSDSVPLSIILKLLLSLSIYLSLYSTSLPFYFSQSSFFPKLASHVSSKTWNISNRAKKSQDQFIHSENCETCVSFL